jgi:hypothetical protein
LGSGASAPKPEVRRATWPWPGWVFMVDFQHFGFHGPGAAETPAAGGHFFDESELDVVDGGEAGDEEVEEGLEGVGGFVADEDLAGEEGVADGVTAGCGFATRGFWVRWT